MPWNYIYLSFILFGCLEDLYLGIWKDTSPRVECSYATETLLILGSISDWTACGVLIGCWRRGWCEKSTWDAARGVWANYGIKRLPFSQRNHPWSHCDWLGPSSAATPIGQVIERCLRTSVTACIYERSVVKLVVTPCMPFLWRTHFSVDESAKSLSVMMIILLQLLPFTVYSLYIYTQVYKYSFCHGYENVKNKGSLKWIFYTVKVKGKKFKRLGRAVVVYGSFGLWEASLMIINLGGNFGGGILNIQTFFFKIWF
jgi:hypothetical protein